MLNGHIFIFNLNYFQFLFLFFFNFAFKIFLLNKFLLKLREKEREETADELTMVQWVFQENCPLQSKPVMMCFIRQHLPLVGAELNKDYTHVWAHAFVCFVSKPREYRDFSI